jgi:type IV secretory pathway TrbD component
MDDATFIYRNRSEERFYDASTQRMQGGPDKVIVYINGVLCAMDHDARIIIPVSRWKLAEIGLACFMAAIKGKRVAARRLEQERLPEPPPPSEALLEPPLEAEDEESPEDQWERLMKEIRDLSR